MNDHSGALRHKVLVIDDDITLRMLAIEFLEHEGFLVEEAQSAMDAFDLLRVYVPDVILLDVTMPDMDGFETCREIRKRMPDENISIIMMSGFDDLESRKQASEAGAADFIAKPFDYMELARQIKKLVSSGVVNRKLD